MILNHRAEIIVEQGVFFLPLENWNSHRLPRFPSRLHRFQSRKLGFMSSFLDQNLFNLDGNLGNLVKPTIQFTLKVGPTFARLTMINSVTNVKTYYRIGYLKPVKRTLFEQSGQELVDKFLGGCLGHILNWSLETMSNLSLHHVIFHQIELIKPKMWFFINVKNIWFCVTGHALVVGLHFGSSLFDTVGDHDLHNVEVFCCGTQITMVNMLDTFSCGSVHDLDGSLYLSVAYILVLYGFVFGHKMLKIVADWV